MEAIWSLQALYSGYEDSKFKQDMQDLKVLIHKINALPNELSHDFECDSLEKILHLEEDFQTLVNKLASYLSLRQATDTTDSETVALMGQLEQTASSCTKAMASCDAFIVGCTKLDACIEASPFLKAYEYLLKTIKSDGTYMLSDEVEEVIAKMNISAGNAWSNLQEYLTSTLQVPYNGNTLTLSEIRNLAHDANANVRKEAYYAEIKAYEPIKEAVAFSLNNIKSQVNTICDMRKFESPLDMTLHYSRMQRRTLDVMMHTIQTYLPMFQGYLKHKAKLLGYDGGLPWYELFAPLSSATKKYTIEESKKYLIDHFTPFAQDMADMIKAAYDENWIDFYPRQGKVGGAFCANLSFIKQSRILTNFDGALGDIITLAHELGHAYHGMMIENHRSLNTDYSMPLAETASTFNENIIMNAVIEEEADTDTKITLLENQLQDLTQIICDIYSRFRFEQMVFEKRRHSFLFADDLCALMIEAQKEAYGDAIDVSTLHPYMWINKGHYYSSGLSYYNFPYAFGGLFARGLIVLYQKEGEDFLPKYRKMLEATTIASVEEVARMADIDLTKEEFWISSLDTCVENIEEFMRLSKDYILK